MDAQPSNSGGFDGLNASLEFPVEGGGTAKVNFQAGAPALLVLVAGFVALRSDGPGLDRLLNALPSLAECVSGRVLQAA